MLLTVANCADVLGKMPRPLLLVAHRANTPSEISSSLNAGANGIECDVWRAHVAHDIPLKIPLVRQPTRLEEWLDEARRCALLSDEFAFVYFDVKEPSAISEIADLVRAKLPPFLVTMYAVSSFDDREALQELRGTLRPNERLCVDGHAGANEVAAFLRDELNLRPTWFSYGTPSRNEMAGEAKLRRVLARAFELRNAGTIDRIAVWTISRTELAQRYIDAGVDALLIEQEAIEAVRGAVDTDPSIWIATRGGGEF